MDGGVAKDVPMVANPRYLLSRLHREGLHGHSFSLRLHFPLGNLSRYEFGRSVVAACPDYVEAAR